MILQVARRYHPLGQASSPWELREFEQVVWSYDTFSEQAKIIEFQANKDYVAGLLICLVNGVHVDISVFDELLRKTPYSRPHIQAQISHVA